jgi:hypothetical protein
MRTTIWMSLSAALLFGACAADSDPNARLGHPDDEHDGECKIEGSDIGRDGASVTVGGETIVFSQWVPKQGSNGEYVGFTLSVGNAHYKVKAGTDVYLGYGATWMHPYGDDGPDAHAISNVDFCDEPPEECDYDAGVDHPEDPGPID